MLNEFQININSVQGQDFLQLESANTLSILMEHLDNVDARDSA